MFGVTQSDYTDSESPFTDRGFVCNQLKYVFFCTPVTCKNVDIVQMNPPHTLYFRG